MKKSNEKIDSVKSILPLNLKEIIDSDISLIDVRSKLEREKGLLKNSINIPLNDFDTNTLIKSDTYYIHCAGGYRSMIACSLLKRLGFSSLFDISGGFADIRKVNLKIN